MNQHALYFPYFFCAYRPMHEVAPSAVTIAVDFDLDLFYTTGCDTQLKRALQYIENGN